MSKRHSLHDASALATLEGVSVLSAQDLLGPVSRISLSSSQKLLLVATKRGAVHIRLLNAAALEKAFSVPLHDPDYGPVTAVCTTGSDLFLVTAGSDGNLFALGLPADLQLQSSPQPKNLLPISLLPNGNASLESTQVGKSL